MSKRIYPVEASFRAADSVHGGGYSLVFWLA
jgi:hypothetical protein